MNRSAEHRLGQLLNSSKRAEAVLGAPTARFLAPKRVPCWRSKLPKKQADYLGVPPAVAYQPELYRY